MEAFVGGEGGRRMLVESDGVGKGLSKLRGDDRVGFLLGTGLLETHGSVVFLGMKAFFFVILKSLIIFIKR